MIGLFNIIDIYWENKDVVDKADEMIRENESQKYHFEDNELNDILARHLNCYPEDVSTTLVYIRHGYHTHRFKVWSEFFDNNLIIFPIVFEDGFNEHIFKVYSENNKVFSESIRLQRPIFDTNTSKIKYEGYKFNIDNEHELISKEEKACVLVMAAKRLIKPFPN